MALTQRALARRSTLVLFLGMLGAALFYGDAILTPAISVLSAVEGLKVVSPGMADYVVPISLALIIGLYAVQSFGTSKVAGFFGPIMSAWFLALGLIGIVHLVANPGILAALNPLNGLWFMTSHGIVGFTVLGSVFLAVTGAEALYADLGHFGKKPIRFAWLFVVAPCLILNYLGQGAFALSDPGAIENLFFLSAPEWARLPLVLLATAATIIAGQAVITGAFSLTQQAIQLGVLPRLEIEHTSATERGQIYLPTINWMMLAGVVALVLAFGSSSALAAAYGIAVTGTMVVTSLMAIVVFAYGWKWGLGVALAVVLPFLAIDLAFLSANVLKIHDGGWLPLAIAAVIMVLMGVWMKGTRIATARAAEQSEPIESFAATLERSSVLRVPGTAMFLTSNPDVVPDALRHNLKHNHVLHDTNVVLAVRTAPTPYVREEGRATLRRIDRNFTVLELRFGFLEEPNILKALVHVRQQIDFDIMSTTFFVGRRSMKAGTNSRMPRWQRAIYIKMAHHSYDATNYFRIPANRVVELGTRVNL
jgi:KUP system potassium uptake protein